MRRKKGVYVERGSGRAGSITRRLLYSLLALAFTTPAAAQSEPSVVRALSVSGDAERAEVVLEGDFDVPRYAVRTRDEGRVVVLEVEGASLPEEGLAVSGGAGLVDSSASSTTARGVVVTLGLSRPVSPQARAGRGRVTLSLRPVGVEAQEQPSESTGAPEIRGVHVERRDGRDRVVIELDRAARFRTLPIVSGPARLVIDGARVGEGVASELRVDAGEDLVVRAVRVRGGGSRATVEVERQDGARGTAIREGNRIVWLFSAAEGRQARPTSRSIAREQWAQLDDEETVDGEEVAAFLTDVPMQIGRARGSRRYRGRRIDLDFHNADIHNILRLIAEVGGVNIVTSDDVSGTVTIRMRNVPWDQALDVILQAKGLGMVRRGNLIRVAPLSTLEKERELAIARQKQQVELAPLETRLIPVSYATATDLSPRVQELLTGRGNVSVDERTNVLIVRDTIDSLDDIEELVRTLDTQTPQVLVEARIVEATSQYVRDVGIQWGGNVIASTATGNPTGLIFPANVGVTGGNYDQNTPTQGLTPFAPAVPTPNYAVNLPATTNTGNGGALGLTLGSLGGTVNVNVRLSAAESTGVVRIISSPRILTLDNHEAHIAQGTLIPYSQISAQGVQTAFQEAKLELRVTPHVTADGSVSMHVKVTRDEPDFTRTSARGDPTILKREAETHLLIEDGHTAVIGGIYTRNTGRNVDQVPFFGDIPILGVLFQRRRVRDERNELLIFLTPRIVNRAESLRR
ncbi:MAG: type IV pilus secretin PilQ [Myxococcota bacterium]|nr:type IV pilus secretin PilQ [Myxococcota bacterium]